MHSSCITNVVLWKKIWNRAQQTIACFRPQFKMGKFYRGINVNSLYSFDIQNETLTKILGSSKLLQGRLQRSVQYLARGHMVAKADFVYGSQQKSTFWFVNVAPQWQTFNAGNWRLLEESVRDLASTRQLELDVYTGICDQMTMEDVNGVQQPIYLYLENGALFVPKYFWKVVYDPLRKQGTAFVGLNDPFIDSIANITYLCKDVTKQITWLNWSPTNITAGISYACTVNDLRRKVPEMPYFRVTGLLKWYKSKSFRRIPTLYTSWYQMRSNENCNRDRLILINSSFFVMLNVLKILQRNCKTLLRKIFYIKYWRESWNICTLHKNYFN